VFEELGRGAPLKEKSDSLQGIVTGDDGKLKRLFWEFRKLCEPWRFIQGTVPSTREFGGRECVVNWVDDGAMIARPQGLRGWGREGVCVNRMGSFECSRYSGDPFDINVAALVPTDPKLLPALWAYCLSAEFGQAVRRLDRKLNVTNATIGKVPFDVEKWTAVATQSFPFGLPEPQSDDPTQWIFHGRPDRSDNPLQVALSRLLGYRWPAEQDEEMGLATAARDLVLRCEELDTFVDADGIVCIPAVRGEESAADQVRTVLTAAYGDEWSPAKQEELLASVGYGGKSLDEWLRNGFFEQHCKLFHHRPFVWHVWDGRKTDGFGALVNYHKLDAKLLEKLIYFYLGDWIKRQEQAVAQGESGADARLLAAQQLQGKLKLIAEGEPPYDIFVRWKPIEQQAIGWNPDLNDGVRMNIRPFMEADILRKNPNIKWEKDRGKEPTRPREQYPWFWTNGEFTGDRVNDVHLTNAEKQAARERDPSLRSG
jgi:hypothetical protein